MSRSSPAACAVGRNVNEPAGHVRQNKGNEVKTILSTITQRLTAKRDQHLTTAQKFKALIIKAATSGGDLSTAEAAELLTLAESLGISTETLEAKVSDAIAARARFEELVKAMRTMPAATKRLAAANATVQKAEAHLEEVKRKAEAELAAARNAATDAAREQGKIGEMAAELASLYAGNSAEFLPEQTSEILFLQSCDFQFGNPADSEKDYARPMWKAEKSNYTPTVYQTFDREGQLIAEVRN